MFGKWDLAGRKRGLGIGFEGHTFFILLQLFMLPGIYHVRQPLLYIPITAGRAAIAKKYIAIPMKLN